MSPPVSSLLLATTTKVHRMPNRPATLSQQIDYEQFLCHFALPPTTRALPTTFGCPLCQTATMQFLQDGSLHSIWASCSACGFAGDLIELAARILSIPTLEAIPTLVQSGIMPRTDPESIDAYAGQYVGLRERVNTLWQTASAALSGYRSNTVYGLCEYLGLHRILGDFSYAHYALRWAGLATKQSVEELFTPLCYAETERVNPDGRRTTRRGSGPGTSRIFVGIGWNEVLVLPFYDLPGRICGFLLLERDADPLKGDIFYRSLPYGCASDPPHESGLFMFDTLDSKPDRRTDGKVFVCSDPILAVQLQARSVNELCRPLPLVATWRDHKHAPRSVWDNLTTKNLICFGPNQTHTFRDALALNAAVGESKTRTRGWDLALWKLYDVRRSARPVLDAIRVELWRQNRNQSRAWVESLDLTEAQRADLQHLAGEGLWDRIVDGPLMRRVTVAGKAVIETAAGWTLVKGNRSICNARIRIQEIAALADGRQWITGVALLNGRSHSFDASLAEVDRRGLLPIVRDQLLKRDGGILIYDRRWAKLGWDAAVAFQSPPLVERPDRVGWNSITMSFHFPQFRIRQSGRDAVVYERMVCEGPLPCAHLSAPSTEAYLSSASARRPDTETAIFWALTACLLDGLLSGRHGRPKHGILLAGDSAAEIGVALATELGCLCLDVPSRWSETDLQRWLSRQTKAHDVPPLLQLDGGRGREAVWNWLGGIGEKHCILPTNRWAALSLSTQRRWHTIEARHSVPRTWSPVDVQTDILFSFLRDFARRSFCLPPSNKPQVIRLIDHLSTWYEERGGDAGEVRRAKSVLTPAQSIVPAAVFAGMLDEFNSLQDRGNEFLHALNVVGKGTELSLSAFEEFLRHREAPPPDWAATQNGAEVSGLSIQSNETEGQTVWHVRDRRAAAG